MSSSPPERASGVAGVFDRWNRRWASAGVLALAALAVAFVTGVVLAVGYDVHAAAGSVALLELSSPPGRLFRALHAWSSHLLLLLLLLHVVEHVARRSEALVTFAVWLRLVLAVPLVLFLAVSGFMLRGDAEGQLARQILAGLLERLPLVGAAAATALLGAGGDLQLVYVHHVATLTVAVLFIAVEHSRRFWPGARAVLAVSAFGLAAAWLFPPALHDGADPVTKGPWYFVGLQELLHWMTSPGWAWLLLLAPLVALAFLPRLEGPWRRRGVRGALVLLACYALVGAWAQFFRGAGWEVSPAWRGALPSPLTVASVPVQSVPEVLGRREGCLSCHFEVGGLGASHDPNAIGCFSCHLGKPFRPDARGAHEGMVLVPGNLVDVPRTCGQAGCHDAIATRVQGALMTRAPGIVSVDRFAFGEQPTPDGDVALAQVGRSPADSHLRQLCSSCHLGAAKARPGPTTELSRGGGCVACHLSDVSARTDAKWNPGRFVHAGLTLKIRDENCFGCHSRSARISLSYAGWWDAEGAVGEAAASQTRQLADGRHARRAVEDVHHAKGMACIDCHTAQETMGDGKAHRHEDEATHVRCETCHRTQPARSSPLAALDAEPSAVVRLREGKGAPAALLLEDRTGEALTNAWPLPDGTVEVRGKVNGERHLAKRPASACGAIAGHERLSCQSCHSEWVPQCIGCHTQFDAKDRAWVEYDVAPRQGLASLGLFERDARTSIEPFAPGMVMTLNPPGALSPVPLPRTATPLIGKGTRFVRAYALAVPHTTTRKGRSCQSCHLDPNALGYGQGRLFLETVKGAAIWRFEPSTPASPFDGLPSDAWIGFLSEPTQAAATRTAARPLELAAQRRTLEAGACMTCHDPATPAGAALYLDYRAARDRRSPRCAVVAP